MRKKPLLILLLIVTAIGLGVWKLAQAVTKGGKLGDDAVALFHARFNVGEDAEILKDSAEAFQKAVVIDALRATNRQFREKLGKFVKGNRTGTKLDNQNGDTSLHLTYDADYEKGKVVETFVFDYNGDRPLLFNYVLNSPSLEKQPGASTPALEK
jgi:hypothetical protein